MSNPEKPNVTVTRWWWVRHAPVRSDGGNIYGQEDIDCDTGDVEVFEAVAKMLPRDAVWYSSNLKRTHKTAEAIWAAGFPKPANMTQERDFAEQHLGRWQGMNRAALLASQPPGRSWFADVNEPAPCGESFMDLYTRVCRTIVRITAAEPGKNIIAVGHGGVIRAAVGLALGGQPDRGLSFDIDNVSVTRLDHIAGTGLSTWRLPMVNQQPWIADPRHAAMHQPSGPEVRPASKLA
ncbi:histidine phosphatase family protein [Bradyrhizobium sp. 26S5]|uniref:histidine phosphatase family protein n=1 Tax=Bradyrhizobium sp. 26S5 TaxID=3139729 RepID=UPI0030D4F2B5